MKPYSATRGGFSSTRKRLNGKHNYLLKPYSEHGMKSIEWNYSLEIIVPQMRNRINHIDGRSKLLYF